MYQDPVSLLSYPKISLLMQDCKIQAIGPVLMIDLPGSLHLVLQIIIVDILLLPYKSTIPLHYSVHHVVPVEVVLLEVCKHAPVVRKCVKAENLYLLTNVNLRIINLTTHRELYNAILYHTKQGELECNKTIWNTLIRLSRYCSFYCMKVQHESFGRMSKLGLPYIPSTLLWTKIRIKVFIVCPTYLFGHF